MVRMYNIRQCPISMFFIVGFLWVISLFLLLCVIQAVTGVPLIGSEVGPSIGMAFLSGGIIGMLISLFPSRNKQEVESDD